MPNLSELDEEVRRLRDRSHAATSELQRIALGIATLQRELDVIKTQIPSELGTKFAVLSEQSSRVAEGLQHLQRTLDDHYVGMTRYVPVERLIFGAVGTILVLVLGGLMALILRTK